ncbi:MAG TPA: GntR family transcriptional regulator [Anaerolineaceae bacterium]|nr:GntR family transcriptional regulator [Anaerolineaceae bacterium]
MPEASHPFQRLQSGLAVLIAKTPPGERLPSEPELARKLGVSRATLREAMRTFEGQGLIRRKQGVGTFVVNPTQVIESGLEVLESIETLAERIGLEVSLGDLLVKEIDADELEAKALEIEPGARLIQVSRVIQAENRPVAFLVDILPEDILMPSDLKSGFTGSVLDLLLKRGNPPLSQSYTEIRAVAASTEVARALEIQRGDVLLMFIASLYASNGKVIDHSYSYFLPGYFRFHVVRSVGPLHTPSWAAPEQERRS